MVLFEKAERSVLMKLRNLFLLAGVLLTAASVAGCGNTGGNSSPNQSNPQSGRAEKVNLTVSSNGEREPVAATLYQGEGYSIYIPDSGFRYERDFDDGAREELWESITNDDAKVKVSLYKNTTEDAARSAFLRENDDYIFEDLTGEPLVGTESDGDELWFSVVPRGADAYVVSWKYPKRAKESLGTVLAEIAGTFKINE